MAVLQWQRGQAWLCPAAACRVQRLEIATHHPQRPAIGHDVVTDQCEEPVGLANLPQGGPYGQVASQVEWLIQFGHHLARPVARTGRPLRWTGEPAE